MIDILTIRERMAIIREHVGELRDKYLLVLALSHSDQGLDILKELKYTTSLDYVRSDAMRELPKAIYPKLAIGLVLSILFYPPFNRIY